MKSLFILVLKLLLLKIKLLLVLMAFINYCTPEGKIPRFVSTKANEVNLRAGPGVKYPIEWVFVKKNEPLEVVNEFEQWRYVRDMDNSFGWVHASVLSNNRVVVIDSDSMQNLYKLSNKDSEIIAYLEPKVRCIFKKCFNALCKVKCNDYMGWVDREKLWGVSEDD